MWKFLLNFVILYYDSDVICFGEFHNCQQNAGNSKCRFQCKAQPSCQSARACPTSFLAHPKSSKNAHFITFDASACQVQKRPKVGLFRHFWPRSQCENWPLTFPHPSVTAKVHSVSLLKGTGTSLINRTWANYSESWAEFQFNLLNKLSNSLTKASVDAADTAKKTWNSRQQRTWTCGPLSPWSWHSLTMSTPLNSKSFQLQLQKKVSQKKAR